MSESADDSSAIVHVHSHSILLAQLGIYSCVHPSVTEDQWKRFALRHRVLYPWPLGI